MVREYEILTENFFSILILVTYFLANYRGFRPMVCLSLFYINTNKAIFFILDSNSLER